MAAPETFTLESLIPSAGCLFGTVSRAIAPRKPMTVSEWADTKRWLSSKSSPKPGRWRTSTNPPLREPMDCMSVRSAVQDMALMFPIQFGKSEVETNTLGYIMDQAPGPVMVCLPGEVSMNKWVNQKLNPLIEETPAVREALTSTNSRNAANQKEFKDFAGGQLYVEHAGSAPRLKQTTVRYLLVDELTEFATALKTGDDPLKMLEGRTSAFPDRGKRMYVSTPGVRGLCRISELWEKSDQRRYHVPCPHCGHEQPLEWDGLKWQRDAAGNVTQAWYVCRDCGTMIDEHHKTVMIAAGRWVPAHPERTPRGYHVNCLYYQIGMGPRWADLAADWLDAQGDPAKLKTFVNDRLAEPWEDKSLKAVKSNILQERAEPYPLRVAPHGVIWITAGTDTQDDRLECQIIGWGRGLTCWVIDYVVLWGDPQQEDVWVQLTDLLNRPIEHACGAMLPVSATAIDGRGHRTQAVKDFVRKALIRRPMAIYGAKATNALPLGRPKTEDVDHKGKTDAADDSLRTWQVGTIAIKHTFFRRLASDAEQPDKAKRWVRFPDVLERSYFAGLVSETFDPVKGRYRKKSGARNEPLDTWVYAYAATHHPELRLHRYARADWDTDERRILDAGHIHTTPEGQHLYQSPQEQGAQPSPSPAAIAAAPQPRAPLPPQIATPKPAPRPQRRTARSTYISR
ncbi:terminase (bacteriophage), large subunit [Aromatoleum aromaticum EbN1]|uniref:Terminase (Bacteriophage), large subunit n=1 Tax=Aromatoleum aromaticum (strain DSM 19018 / LMG 30748 / EbN1) TaxID=76114 RepID=Q5NXG6_AROAE|nr:phage terminase large subunit family protein [Aromatoleum aromaticum]CAI10248.1 terminase (bacteriophage), large subunit [Aromatoleum aromaticum EbN1]